MSQFHPMHGYLANIPWKYQEGAAVVSQAAVVFAKGKLPTHAAAAAATPKNVMINQDCSSRSSNAYSIGIRIHACLATPFLLHSSS